MQFLPLGKIVPEHCATIIKTTLKKIRFWPWKRQVGFQIPKIIADATFVKKTDKGATTVVMNKLD